MPDDFEPFEPLPPAPTPSSAPSAQPAPPSFGAGGPSPFSSTPLGPAPPPSFPTGPSAFASAPPGWTGPPRRNGLATAALVLGLCSLVTFLFVVPPVLAIVFGFVGASQIKKSNGATRGLAFARWGWALGIVGVLAAAGVYAAIAADGGFSEDRVSPSEVEVGDCFDDPSLVDLPTDGESFRAGLVEVIDCSEPHHAEAFHVGRLNPSGDAPYPGQDAVEGQMFDLCYGDTFESYVGIGYDESRFEVVFYFPQKALWRIGRGAFSCVLIDPLIEPLVGSQRGSGE